MAERGLRRIAGLAGVAFCGLLAVGGARAAALPAFPGAEGYGATSTGGRGGRVVHVTSLGDSGTGSLRWALEREDGPMIVVFDVGGTIELFSDIRMRRTMGRVTIAGQTAPGGLTIIGANLWLPRYSSSDTRNTPDIIIRNLRIRGVHNVATGGTEGPDVMNIYKATRVVVDHCSFTGSADETLDTIHTYDLTVQWCTFEESALWGQGGNQHPEGDHRKGFTNSYGEAGNVTIHHNLFADHDDRNPRITGGPADVRNNVVFNFLTGFTGGRRGGEFNLVGNYYRQGPNHLAVEPLRLTAPGRFYVRDELIELLDRSLFLLSDPWAQLPQGSLLFYGDAGRLDSEVAAPPVATGSAEEALALVLDLAGAWPRDSTTLRSIDEVSTCTGVPGLNGPYERFPARSDGPTSARHDRDRDGMPDSWESAHGLDPADPADGNRTVPAGASPGDRHAGYTYVEYYLNELMESLVGVSGETFVVEVKTSGSGRIVTVEVPAHWDPEGAFAGREPIEVPWGTRQAFNKGSRVGLKAAADAGFRFSRWSGGPAEGLREPVIEVTVDSALALTAHFVEEQPLARDLVPPAAPTGLRVRQ